MKTGQRQLLLQQTLPMISVKGSLVLLCLLVIVQNCKASRGLEFQLSLRGFHNPAGRLADGRCCSESGACPGACRTFVRVCVSVRREIGAVGGGFPGPNDTCAIVDSVTGLIGVNNLSQPLQEQRIDPKAWMPNRAFTVVLDLLHLPEPFTVTNKAWGRLIARRVMREKNYLPTGNWTVHSRTLDVIGLEFGYRFRCRLGFYGHSCQKQCTSRDDMLGHYTCSPAGEIRCLPGYSGPRCTTPTCQPASCVHGSCTGPNRCSCFTGWRGANCSACIPMPQCSSRGYCTKPLECLCPPGYGGLFCDIDLHWCQHNRNPCLNGGRCKNLDQRGYNYTCLCPPGFAGFHCEREVRNCSEPWGACLNGGVCLKNGSSLAAVPSAPATSSGRSGGPTCGCPRGYYGSRCQFNYTTCADRPCGDRGDCRDLPTGGGFACSCHPGWAGRGCEVNLNDCPEGYCANGGQCVDLVNRFQCVCRLNYRGPRCTVNLRDCRNLTCLNGGVCRDLADGLGCDCPAGLSGKFCELGAPAASDYSTVSWSSNEGRRQQPTVALLLLAAAVLVLLLLLLVAVASVFAWQRRRKRQSQQTGAAAAAAAAGGEPDSDDDNERREADRKALGRQKIESFGESTKLRNFDDDFYSVGAGDGGPGEPPGRMNNSRRNLLQRPGLAEAKTDYFASKQINNLLSASQGCLSPRELRHGSHGMQACQSRPRLHPSSSMQFPGRLATVSRAGLSSAFVHSAAVAMRHTRIPSCEFGRGPDWA